MTFYAGFLMLLAPMGGGVLYQKANSFGQFVWRFGLITIVCLACIPIGMVIGLGLKLLSRRQTGVSR